MPRTNGLNATNVVMDEYAQGATLSVANFANAISSVRGVYFPQYGESDNEKWMSIVFQDGKYCFVEIPPLSKNRSIEVKGIKKAGRVCELLNIGLSHYGK